MSVRQEQWLIRLEQWLIRLDEQLKATTTKIEEISHKLANLEVAVRMIIDNTKAIDNAKVKPRTSRHAKQSANG